MVTKKNMVVIYLAAVFLAGLLAGGAAGFSIGQRKAFKPPRPGDIANHMCDHLRARLHLTPDQVTQIEPVLKQTAGELEMAHARSAERISQIFDHSNQRLAQFLTTEQRQELDQMERERRQFIHKTFKPHHPSPTNSAFGTNH